MKIPKNTRLPYSPDCYSFCSIALRSWKSRVVVAQWLEHWWLKPVALGSIPGDNQDFLFFFLCFFPESFYQTCVTLELGFIIGRKRTAVSL